MNSWLISAAGVKPCTILLLCYFFLMQAERVFSFDDKSNGDRIEVRIPEQAGHEDMLDNAESARNFAFIVGNLRLRQRGLIVDPQYGMFTWPAAPVLAQFIWHNRKHIKGKQVIEIGAGTALPGLVASLCGAHVTLTDKEEYPECLDNCRQSCQANGHDFVKVVGITWGQFTPNLFKLVKADIILGSDCFYDTKDFDDILATVSFLMEKNPQAKFWTTYQERSSSRSIEDLLKKWGLKGVQIPLGNFNADYSNIGDSIISDLHTIQMLEITSQ